MPFFSITELPDYQYRMSLHKEVIQQCFLAGHSFIYDCWTSVSILCFFLCLSRCQKAHRNILKPYVVKGVIKMCELRSEYNPLKNKSVNLPEVQATKYAYKSVVF